MVKPVGSPLASTPGKEEGPASARVSFADAMELEKDLFVDLRSRDAASSIAALSAAVTSSLVVSAAAAWVASLADGEGVAVALLLSLLLLFPPRAGVAGFAGPSATTRESEPLFPSFPVRELKPRNAARTRTSERAAREDFFANSPARLYVVESMSSAVRPRSSSMTISVRTRRIEARAREMVWRTALSLMLSSAAISSVLRPSISHITSAVRSAGESIASAWRIIAASSACAITSLWSPASTHVDSTSACASSRSTRFGRRPSRRKMSTQRFSIVRWR